MTGLTHEEIAHSPLELTTHERRAINAAIVMLEEEDRAAHDDPTLTASATFSTSPNSTTTKSSSDNPRGSKMEASSRPPWTKRRSDRSFVWLLAENTGARRSGRSASSSVAMASRDTRSARSGLFGPTRMEYYRAISGARFISTIMKDMVESVYGAA